MILADKCLDLYFRITSFQYSYLETRQCIINKTTLLIGDKSNLFYLSSMFGRTAERNVYIFQYSAIHFGYKTYIKYNPTLQCDKAEEKKITRQDLLCTASPKFRLTKAQKNSDSRGLCNSFGGSNQTHKSSTTQKSSNSVGEHLRTFPRCSFSKKTYFSTKKFSYQLRVFTSIRTGTKDKMQFFFNLEMR